MPHLNRRGLTLVELLVALVLLSIVSAALYRVLVSNQRIYQAQTQRIDMQQNIRAAAQILPADLRELDASEGDISAASATSVTFRAMRWIGIMCSAPVTGPLPAAQTPGLVVHVVVRRPDPRRQRDPADRGPGALEWSGVHVLERHEQRGAQSGPRERSCARGIGGVHAARSYGATGARPDGWNEQQKRRRQRDR